MNKSINTEKILKLSPSICLTHNCNLDCVYCYQTHDNNSRMSIKTAKKIIDWIFDNAPDSSNTVGIDFIGGEPLLEFPLIKQIVEYTCTKKKELAFRFLLQQMEHCLHQT